MPTTSKCRDRCVDCGRPCVDFLCAGCEVKATAAYHNPFDYSDGARPQIDRERRARVAVMAKRATKRLPTKGGA